MSRRAENYQAQLPTLSTWHWRKHTHMGYPALRHKSGSVVVFKGPNPVQARNIALKNLNKFPRPKLERVNVGSGWIDDEVSKRRRSKRRKRFRLVVTRRKGGNCGSFGATARRTVEAS